MENKLNIVQINTSYGNNDSTGRNAKEMHKWLKNNGYNSYVYASTFNEDNVDDEDVYLFSNKVDKKIHALLSRLTGLQGYFSKYSTNKLIKDIDKRNPSVVILHVLHDNSINFPSLFKYLKKGHIPTILVLHDCWYMTGHCCHWSQANCLQWQHDCCYCDQIHLWNKSWFFDTAKKCLKDKRDWYDGLNLGVVGVSKWITEEAKKSILKNAKEIKTIYNWTDLDTFKQLDIDKAKEELGIDKDKKVLLAVASGWSEIKGFNEVIKCAGSFKDVLVLVIGDVPDKSYKGNNIRYVGTIKDPKLLAKYYNVADVFINPSKQESFGKTTAEAISCGTPVVAYNTSACTELIEDKRGILVKPYDENEFIKGVEIVLNKDKSSYKEKLISFSKDNFDMNKNIQKYVNLIKELGE